jgi:micrococcal nuclease
MRIPRFLVCFALVFSLGSYGAYASSIVASIYDGDTLTLTNGNKVRLVQIDTPELSPAECFGLEAKEILEQLIGTSSVTLVKEPLAGNKDSFGRLLRYVKVSSKILNLELVKRGAAAPWFYNGQKGKFSMELLDAARTAKMKKIGLWKACPSTVLDPTKGIETGPVTKKTNEGIKSSTQEKNVLYVNPGAFCSEMDLGKTGVSSNGFKYTCKSSAKEARLRWRR